MICNRSIPVAHARAFDRIDASILAPIIMAELPKPCKRLIDIGCGRSRLPSLLAGHAQEVLAIDVDPEAIDYQKNQRNTPPNLQFTEMSIEMLGSSFPKSTFDVAISVFALHELDVNSALSTIMDTLQPSGRIIIIDLYSTFHGTLTSYLLDQFILSHVANTKFMWRTLRRIGAYPLVRFLYQHVQAMLSPAGIKHARSDISCGCPPSWSAWTNTFARLPLQGVQHPLFGPFFLFAGTIQEKIWRSP